MAQRIKTNIKFHKGLDKAADKIYGFVTKSNKSWRGCNVTDEKKKIVFVDSAIEPNIIPNMLYKCSLVPMHNDQGFIAKSATLIQFPGTISTVCRKNVFVVSVKFGNKVFIYDPASKDRRKRDIKSIADALRVRMDLLDAQTVTKDFVNNACMIKRLYEQSQSHV